MNKMEISMVDDTAAAVRRLGKLIIVVLGIFLLTAPAGADETQFAKNKRELQSYATGVEIPRNFARQGFDYDLDMVMRGMKDAAAGGKLLWSEEDLTATRSTIIAEFKERRDGITANLSRQELEQKARLAEQDIKRKKQERFLAGTKTAESEEVQQSRKKREMQSYAMGVEMLRNFNRQKFDYDLDMVLQGMKDEALGGKLRWKEEYLTAAQRMSVAELKYKRGQDRARMQQDNKKKGEEFLAANKTNEGVVALPSGLQYRILKEGDGRKPTESDRVKFQYRGTRIDGAELDNSGQSGQQAVSRKVAEVIPGWREALKLMPEGSRWQLFLPSELAYGQRGAGRIGPYETTIYEIELVAIE